MEFIRNIRDWHENFKKKVHSFRIPLGPTGRGMMQIVYITLPIYLGYQLMQIIIGISENNLKNMQKLKGDKFSNISQETIEQNRALQEILDHHNSKNDKK